MSEPKMAYLVTHGDYSSYEVLGVFSTRELADAFAAEQNALRSQDYDARAGAWMVYGIEADVEEMPLDVPIAPRVGAWSVRVKRDGSVNSAYWSENDNPSAPARTDAFFGPQRAEFVGYGPTPEHARRSAEDARRAYLTSPQALAAQARTEGEAEAWRILHEASDPDWPAKKAEA